MYVDMLGNELKPTATSAKAIYLNIRYKCVCTEGRCFADTDSIAIDAVTT